MSTAIFSAPKFVKIESSDKKQLLWWPGFVANSWKELMNVLCQRSKALASLSYLKIDMEKRNSDQKWIYLVGETLPFEKSRLMMVDEAQLCDLILDFYDNLDTMCVKHASFEHWNHACEEISRWIEGKNLELLKVSKFSEDTSVTNVSTEVSSFLENDRKIHEHAKLEADALIHPKKPTRTNTSSRATPKDKKASSKDIVSDSYRKARVITSISTNPSDSMGHEDETVEDKHIANKVKRDRTGSLKTVKTSISTSAKKLNGGKKAVSASNVTLATPNLNPYSRNFPDRQEALLYAHSNIQTPVNSASPSSSIGTKLSSNKISTKRIGTEIGVDAKEVSPSDASKSIFPPLEKKYFPVNEEFENVLQTLKDRYGWRVIKGSKSSLVKLYYVTGRYADSSIHHIQNVLTLNEDYFKSADAVKVFLRKKVGWRGPAPMKQLSPTAAPAEIEKHLETVAPAEIEEHLETAAPAETVKIEKHLRFVTVWEILQSKYGFHYRSSSLWFWNGTSKGKKVADLKANEDYFETEDDLKEFVHKKFGWVGPQGKEFYPVFAAGRANRRKRNNFGETKVGKNTSLAPQSASKVDLRDVLSEEVTGDKPSTKEPVLKKRKTNEKMATEIITSPHDSSTLRKSTKGRKNVRDPKPRTNNISVDTHQDENKARSRMSATKAKEVNIGRLKDDRGVSPDSSDLARKTKPKFSAHHMNIGEVKEDYNIDERDLPLKAKLENCSKSLCISNTSDDILFTGTDISSNFFVAKDRIVSFLEKCISKNIDPKHSSVLNICGRPGTGKVSIFLMAITLILFDFRLILFSLVNFQTTMIQHCLRTMQDSGEYPEFNSTFLNAASISSYGKLIEEIAMALGKKPNITIPMIEKKLSYKMTAPLIVVVDEIDFLIGGHRQSKSKEESPIDTVFRWASKPEFALTLICISNSVGDENAKLLHKMVKVNIHSLLIFLCAFDHWFSFSISF